MTSRLPRIDETDRLPKDAQPGVDGEQLSSAESLRQALRRARLENAERASVVAELRTTEAARLELLREALNPLLAQIPPDIDLFDVGVTMGSQPRLFIDAICFVEMGRDARNYRLFQDTRRGRLEVVETDQVNIVVDAITEYVARRMIERDKALSADTLSPRNEPVGPPRRAGGSQPAERSATTATAPLRWMAIGFAFVIDLLGSLALLALCLIAIWYVWVHLVAH